MAKDRDGWGYPGRNLRAKAHYFRDGNSLCGSYIGFRGGMADPEPPADSCAKCKQRAARAALTQEETRP